MRRDFLAIIALLVILAVMMGGLLGPIFMITGYDGIEATITRADHDYELYTEHTSLVGYGIDPYQPGRTAEITSAAETGLRVEIGQPRQIDTRMDWSDSISVLDAEAETNITTLWEVHIVYLEMGATITTYGEGVWTIRDVDFWIRLIENPYSYFTGADESEAYILAVTTTEKARIVGDIDVEPTGKAYGFPLTSLSDDPVPQWILDSGYQKTLGEGKEVEFALQCLKATPSHIFGFFRQEATATFTIQVEVLLFGEWEVVQEYIEWDWPIPDDFLADLLVFLVLFFWVALGFIATIIILRFVPNGKMKILGIAVVWIVLLALYGFNAITVWMGG